MRKFLIIQTSFIGDVVLATAISEKLHTYFPKARIDFLLRKGNETLLLNHPFISKVWVWDKKKQKLLNLFKLAAALSSQQYDDVINLQRFFSTGLLTVLSGGKIKRGFDKNPLSRLFNVRRKHKISADGVQHETERNQMLIADITDEKPALPRLYPSVDDEKNIAGLVVTKYICCAAGSVWFTKQYPQSNWVSFMEQLPDDVTVYLIGAASDGLLSEEIINQSKLRNAKNLCGKLTYLESVALMKGAVMNFVNDSAPLHFASAINAPVTAIFCSTVPQFGFGPLSYVRHIIQTELNLACKPCGIHGYSKCPLNHFKCGHTISADRLIAIVNERRN